jgi:hypothetical protein
VSTVTGFKLRQVVKDDLGSHFIIRDMDDVYAECESVATREVFTIPFTELFPTDREVF